MYTRMQSDESNYDRVDEPPHTAYARHSPWEFWIVVSVISLIMMGFSWL